MEVHNRYVVAKGHRIAHKNECYKAGRKFPAAHLKISEESVAAHLRDGSIFDPKDVAESPVAEAPPMDDGMGDYSKPELTDIAERYGIDVKSRMSKDEIIAAIRGRPDSAEPKEPEEPEEK